MIFLDTSFIVSFYNTRDENNQKAVKIIEEIDRGKYGVALISDYIFDECVTVIFARIKSLRKTIEIGESVKESKKMVEVDRNLFKEAWNIFKTQEGTGFSFTDCTTLAVMEAENIKNIATFDYDFKKIKWINVIDGL